MSLDKSLAKQLDKTVAFNSGDVVKNLSSILLNYYGITHFCYLKSFSDFTHILLSADLEWVRCFYTDYYQYAPHHKNEAYYLPGYALWSTQADPTARLACRDNFNIDHGITLIQKQKNYTEFFNFATTRENPQIINFYINNMDILLRFSMYFKEQAKELIRKANSDRLILPKCIATDEIIPNRTESYKLFKEHRTKFEKNLFLDRYYIDEEKNIYLTQKEFECVTQLLQGKTAKEITRALAISLRTAEAHLDNSRMKLNCRNKIELVTKVLGCGFLKLDRPTF